MTQPHLQGADLHPGEGLFPRVSFKKQGGGFTSCASGALLGEGSSAASASSALSIVGATRRLRLLARGVSVFTGIPPFTTRWCGVFFVAELQARDAPFPGSPFGLTLSLPLVLSWVSTTSAPLCSGCGSSMPTAYAGDTVVATGPSGGLPSGPGS